MLPLLLMSSLLSGTVLAQAANPSQAAPATSAASSGGSGGAGKGGGSGSGSGSGTGAGTGTGRGSGSGTNIPFGEPITKCQDPNAFALTFDDGPFQFTNTLLDTLKQNKLKATFFVNGKNFGQIADFNDVLQRMLKEGHQIGSHTFDHKDLATLQEDAVEKEMTDLDNELQKLIKMTPVYMRPPFFRTNELALGVMKKLQYHVVNADIDTKDFENTTPETNDVAFENFKKGFTEGGTISLMHDVHNTTVNQLIPNVVKFFAQGNRKSLTVGECLGDPKENWYRAGNGAKGPAGPAKAGPTNKPKRGGCNCGRKAGKGGKSGKSNEGLLGGIGRKLGSTTLIQIQSKPLA